MSLATHTPPAFTAEEARDPVAVSRRLAARGVALQSDEVTLLLERLGRPPRWAEAVLFGILWSEHCSYKSSRHLLKWLPTEAPQVILGPGEDAGVVALPAPCEHLALVMAHESHNHPSQVLPVEGAATGIGGIVRDVGCMGAEVVGVLDALRFGDPVTGGVEARDIVRGVVQGVADYANALGVPNLGGDAVFDAGFGSNCLVNVMALGLVPRDGILRSRVPEGNGPWVFVLVGKPTDDSGFGGASFASDTIGAEDRRGAVQLPDPFLKRVLHVANAEMFRLVRERGISVGFKDLGAGGIACATSELAAAGGRGAVIALDAAHRVSRTVAPEVLLCAETQERYCWVLPEAFAAEACSIYNERFALDDVMPGAGARVIGRATDERRYVVTWGDETLVDCPVDALTTGRRIERPARRRKRAASLEHRANSPDVRDALLGLLGTANGASRDYLYRHYDGEVQGRTWLRRGEGDATVFRADPDRSLGVALAVGGHPHWCASDPELGAAHAVAEAARRVACVGARPLALTDCLNFGSPEDPEVMGDLEATLAGLAAAASGLGGLASPGHPLPYVSGNVSLYNQSAERAIPPSPIVLCAGTLADLTTAVGLRLCHPDHFLVLIGGPRGGLGGSLFAREMLGAGSEAPPPLDLVVEAGLQALAVEAAERRWVSAAHQVGNGGVLMAVAEMSMASPDDRPLGADLDLAVLGPGVDETCFSESPAIVFEVAPERADALAAAATRAGLTAWPIGAVARAPRLRLLHPETGTREWERAELIERAGTPLRRLWNEADA